MAIIRPFRGVRYNPAIAGDLSQLVSPPYDVISPEQQTELHLRNPYNAIHLDLNQDADRYGAAAQRFRDWQRCSAPGGINTGADATDDQKPERRPRSPRLKEKEVDRHRQPGKRGKDRVEIASRDESESEAEHGSSEADRDAFQHDLLDDV